jgi:methyl-accepting chemotaxis protein
VSVVSKEFVLPSNMVILSTSDLNGMIVDYNVGFRDASGYTDEELKNQSHNILRHPDMPKEAFKDFWQTLQAGRTWFGFVKNQRKDGDYYWVAANASPIIKNGHITGYLSVRYPATREQIAHAEILYANVRSGREAFPWTKVSSGSKTAVSAAVVVAAAPVSLFVTAINLSSPLLITASLMSLIAGGYLATRVLRLVKPTFEQQRGIEAIANGQFKQKVEGNDYWAFALNMIRSRVAESAARQYDAAREAAVLTTAMNAASTNLMVADAEFNIVSINTSLADMFRSNASALKCVLPQFDADRIVGSNMDIFHKNPAHQRAMVAKLTQPWTGELKVGGLVLRLSVVPIISNGQKVGYVVEWLDRTQEVQLEVQLEQVASASRDGVLHRRVNLENAQGAYRSLGENINELLNILSSFSGVIAHSVGELAFSRLGMEMQGDFKGAYRSVQNSVNLAMRNLNELLGHVQHTSHEVSRSMSQLNEGVSHFSDQTQQQAAAIEQTAAAMAQILSTVKSNANNVQHANSLANGVHARVEDSAKVMQQAIDAMRLIHDSGNQIGDIVGLIDSIAFQTNLLALNAAVEAARAGEHGRGFAVVASEVRALAGKSADAAKDIKVLIDQSVNQIDRGTQLVQKTAISLTVVKEAVDEMSGVVSQIATASREQEKGIDEVNRAVTVMDRVAQQSAALVEETAAASMHVAAQMSDLDAVVRQFTLSSAGKSIANIGRSPLADMKQAHLNWRIRMSNVVQGYEKISDISTVKNHHLCGLGKWRDSDGRQFDYLPEMKNLDVLHEKFHVLVAEAVTSAKEGYCDTANELMTEVDVLSAEIVAVLEQIERSMMNNGAVAVDDHSHHSHLLSNRLLK